MALSLVSAPMLARELGADARGALAGSFVLVQLLSWSFFLGLPRGVAVQHLRHNSSSRAAVLITALLGPVAAVLAIISADAASGGDGRIATGIRVAACTLVLSGLGALGTEKALIQGRIAAINAIRLANLVLPSIAVVIAYYSGFLTLTTAFAFTLGGQAVSIVLGVVFAVPLIRSAQRIKVPWRFSLHYWAGSAFDGIGARVDQLALAAFVMPAQLGVYAVGVTCASAAGGLTQALNQLTYPRLAASNPSVGVDILLRKRALMGLILSTVAGLAVVLLVWVAGSWLFGPTYSSLGWIVAILVVAQIMNDQWQLRTYADSASGDASGLMLSSALATALLVAGAAALAVLQELNGISMALLLVVFAACRLAIRSGYFRFLRRDRGADEGGNVD